VRALFVCSFLVCARRKAAATACVASPPPRVWRLPHGHSIRSHSLVLLPADPARTPSHEPPRCCPMVCEQRACCFAHKVLFLCWLRVLRALSLPAALILPSSSCSSTHLSRTARPSLLFTPSLFSHPPPVSFSFAALSTRDVVLCASPDTEPHPHAIDLLHPHPRLAKHLRLLHPVELIRSGVC
jgi:hypothetical protein